MFKNTWRFYTMELIITIEELEALEQTTLEELEYQVLYQLYFENKQSVFVA